MDELSILQAEVLRTLANPRRLQILHALAEEPMEVGRLAAAIGATQPNVSQHLAVLRGTGIVEAERTGREVQYRLADPDVMIACGLMRAVLERRLMRLGRLAATANVNPSPIASRLERSPWTNPSTWSSSPEPTTSSRPQRS
jgi:DNA-binding transcriptional ArsR family regulator